MANPSNLSYIISQDLVKISSLLPSNKNRSLLVHSLIKSLGLLSPPDSTSLDLGTSNLQVFRPRFATAQELCVYHDTDYVDFVLNSESVGQPTSMDFGIEDDCPPFPGMGSYVQLVAGATLTAAGLLKSGDSNISIAWDGGRHHAQKSRAAGFCYVADCILAIMSLKKGPPLSLNPNRRKPRIMYLDLDLHFSDAVSECFYRSTSGSAPAQVLTLSIHYTSPGFYPANPLATLPDPASPNFDPFTLSLPLKQGASSQTFGRVWSIVETVKQSFSPDYVIVQCGTDGLAGDPHGIWNWSIGHEKGSMDWCVNEVVSKWQTKVLLLGGGGYNSPNTARAWASLTSIAKGSQLATDTTIPDHPGFPLYGPSFTLDVPAGNMRDENSDEYLSNVKCIFKDVVRILEKKMRIE